MIKRTDCCLTDRPKLKKNIFPILLFFVVFLICPLPKANCAQVTLVWDPVNVSNLSGYKIYYGTTSGTYQWVSDAGNVTSYTLSGLNAGTTYYAAATDYLTSGIESTYSNEVMFAAPGACTYTISPLSASFTASGGTGTVSVTTQASCSWSATSSSPWITINNGSGVGSGTLSYTVSPNNNTASQTASLTIAGNTFTVTEAGQSQTNYTISASAGSGGSISPSGQVLVNSGAGKSFTITPNSGYKISDVKVDGVSNGAIASYSFSNVQANHTVAASFVVNSSASGYVLSISTNGSGGGGVSTSPSRAAYSSGTKVTLTATPDAGSVFGGWSGACSGGSPTCKVTMRSNLSVIATFLNTLSSQSGNHDFNGDGMADLLWWNKLTGEVGIWFMNGITPTNNKMIAASGDLNWEIVGVGDFNNDGKVDILWRNKTNGGVVVWYMNGSGGVTNVGWIVQSGDLNWEIVGR
jgi:hypothetical protein